MTQHPSLDCGLTVFHTRLKTTDGRLGDHLSPPCRPFLTISREACAGATTLGRHLVPLLDQELGDEDRSWMFLEKDLLSHALIADHLPKHLATYLPEDRISEIKGLIGEIVGLHPPLWELEQRVFAAIHQIAQVGWVVFSGRAAHLVTNDLPGGFHLRLVASLDTRIKRLQAERSCDRETAEHALHEADNAQRRYVQSHFEREISDPHSYDLTINTDHLLPATVARLVIQALQQRTGVHSTTPSAR